MKLSRYILLFFLAVSISGCGSKGKKSDDLVIFHAGSLTLPIKAAIDSFTLVHPNVKILTEGAGSVECARKITELNKRCDIFFSADYAVIKKLANDSKTDWYIPFAGNSMVLVYNPNSEVANVINSNSWLDVLLQNKYHYGRSDPNSDPCGYRTELVLKLAEKYYNRPGIADSILAKDNRFIRPKEVDLVAHIEAGSIDMLFIYKSVAMQHGLPFIELPVEVNLSSADFAETYSTVSVEITGKTPDSTMTIKGEPMVYGLTIPKTAENTDWAIEFLEYFLRKDGGMAIMEKMGQTSLVPYPTDVYGNIPDELKKFALPAK